MNAYHVRKMMRAVQNGLLDKGNPTTKVFEWAEKRCGVRRTKIFVWLVMAVVMYLSTSGPGTVLLGNLVGFLYPACMTVIALVRSSGGGPEPEPSYSAEQQLQRDRLRHRRAVRLFVYWLVFAAALVAHQLFGGLLRLVPLYELIRATVFVWCYAPASINGSDFVYKLVVRRYLVAPRHVVGSRPKSTKRLTANR
jgi:hypothetical protein